MRILRGFSIVLPLIVLTACASPPPPPPPKPAAAPVSVASPVVAAPKPRPAAPRPKPIPSRPSMAATDEIRFDGDTYMVKADAASANPRQYFLAAETPGRWTRLLELQSHADGKGMSADAFAKRFGTDLKAKDPYLHYTVLAGQRDGSVVLDYFSTDAAALAGHYVELHAYKFYPDPATRDIIGFHCVERIDVDPKASATAARAKAQATRERVLGELARMPLYRE